MRIKNIFRLVGILFLCLLVSIQTVEVSAKTVKAPTITVKLSTSESTNKSVKITVTVKSDSSIKTVKWLQGKKKVSHFKNAGEVLKLSKNKTTLKISKNGTYTIYVKNKAGKEVVKKVVVNNIDNDFPSVKLSYSVLNQEGKIDVKASDDTSGIGSILWLEGDVDDIDSEEWIDLAEDITDAIGFSVMSSGTYSVLVSDNAGNKSVGKIDVTLEFNAVWISYLEFGNLAKSNQEFTSKVDDMFDHCADMGMNAVIVQVRPFSDAMYSSKYFPWSRHISGEQGVNPGYDPLEYMVEAAHERNLEIHAWLNPYRVTASLTETGISNAKALSKLTDSLSDNNPAKKWLLSSDETINRNVLLYNKALYYNPSSPDVQKLIINGVKEIVNNYDVDGIHLDDYFYPSMGANATVSFDIMEYYTYKADCETNGIIPNELADWRRNNVSTLIKKTYNSIKKINPSVKFGISPAGNISNLRSNTSYFVDIDKWLSSSGYVDYICPQIYWGFDHSSAAFDKMVNAWVNLRTSNSVNLYIGIPVYKGGSTVDKQNGVSEWATNNDILSRQVEYSRDTGKVDGFMYYRYDSFNLKVAKDEIMNLLDTLFK